MPDRKNDSEKLYVSASDVGAAVKLVHDAYRGLARLSDSAQPLPADQSATDVASPRPDDLYALAESLLRERRARVADFPELSLGEAEWDMVLDLYVHHCRGYSVSVSSACIGSGVPLTTALRHLSWLVDRGVAERAQHPDDARVQLVTLKPSYIRTVERYLTKILAVRCPDR